MHLPSLIRRYNNPLAYLAAWGPYIAIYQLTNRWPVFEPRELPFTAIDNAIPFLPQLIPIYLAYLPLYLITAARSENDIEANRFFYATHFQLLVAIPLFVLCPIAMPRELFYTPEAYNWADAFWRWFDEPNNCFPSLHVANSLMMMQFNWRRSHRWVFMSLSLAIIVSTVVVKQHYVVDAAGGVGVYVASRWFLARLTIGKPLAARFRENLRPILEWNARAR